jgi:hypothetical protein
MFYPVYVHVGDKKHAHGVTIPDFPGCFAAADEWDGIPAAVLEAVQAHVLGDEDAVKAPTPLEALAKSTEYQDGVWMLVDIDLSKIDSRPVRLNISLPSNLVQEIDAWTKEHRMTRSGFIAQAAERAMR